MARREDRKALAMGANCRAARLRQLVNVANLSPCGCMIVAPGLQLAVGQLVVLRPDGLEGLAGFVRWRSDCRAGIEFGHPLHPAIVDHLCRLHPDDGPPMRLDQAA